MTNLITVHTIKRQELSGQCKTDNGRQKTCYPARISSCQQTNENDWQMHRQKRLRTDGIKQSRQGQMAERMPALPPMWESLYAGSSDANFPPRSGSITQTGMWYSFSRPTFASSSWKVQSKVEYFDFYLFHNVCEMNIDAYLDPQYGIYDYLMEQKKNGRIRHLGFSCHGQYKVLKRFLEAYGSDMEFCQLQLNYLDW